MSSLIQCFAAIARSISEKTKMDITGPPPLLADISEMHFLAQETVTLRKNSRKTT